MKNRIHDLRNHLFATLEALQDSDNPMEIARAKAISDVAGKIIDSAKAENDFLKIMRGNALPSNFIGTAQNSSPPCSIGAPAPTKPTAPETNTSPVGHLR